MVVVRAAEPGLWTGVVKLLALLVVVGYAPGCAAAEGRLAPSVALHSQGALVAGFADGHGALQEAPLPRCSALAPAHFRS